MVLILDLSSPADHRVNDGIDATLSSLQYSSVDYAVAMVRPIGRGTLLAKLDIKSAYCNIPVHLDDRWLLGLKWQGSAYVDTVLPFGLWSAPKFSLQLLTHYCGLCTRMASAMLSIIWMIFYLPVKH